MAAFRPKTEPTARDVRIWHWKKVLRATRLMNGAAQRGNRVEYERWNRIHSVHLGCVQAMNDLPALAKTTADYDLQIDEGTKKLAKLMKGFDRA